MRLRYWLLSLLVIVFFSSSFSQDNSSDLIVGDWYLINEKSLEKQDTLLFQKQLIGSSFHLWSFKSGSALRVSNGRIRENNPNAKCFASVLHYKWSIENGGKGQVLLLSFGDKTDKYSIHQISKEKLVLIVFQP